MISKEDVFHILNSDNTEIEQLRKEHEILKMHYYGTGTAQYLSSISGLENEDQLSLRRRFSGTNTALVSSLLNPVNKIFKAKGGSRVIRINNDDSKDKFNQKLLDLNGYSLRQWLKIYWKDKFAVDPNGLFMVEKDKEGNPYMAYKSINRIFRYKPRNQSLDWVIFDPVKIKYKDGNEIELLRVVDEVYDYIYVVGENELTVITADNYKSKIPSINHEVKKYFGDQPYTIKHEFSIVPAYIISDKIDTETGFKLSSIHNEIQLLKEYLIDNSVKRIFKFLHGYPIFWKYFSRCHVCKGEGYISLDNNTYKCEECNGSGYSLKKDVSDVIGLNPIESTDEPKIAPDVAGYVSPSIETWTKMTEELELIEKALNKSHWGVYDITITPKTATGEVLRVQSQLDKLSSYSTSFEKQEIFFTDLLGNYYYGREYEGSSINLGKRYILGDTNQILKEYQESKKNKSDVIILNILLEQYFDGEFENDPISFHKNINLMKIEPLVHYSLDEVLLMGISNETKIKKELFNEWVMSKEENFFLNTYDEYKRDFENFIKTKQDETKQDVPVQ